VSRSAPCALLKYTNLTSASISLKRTTPSPRQ
jgi:hypothetical protein